MYKKSTVYLMSIKQREDQTLRSYITHFNKEVLLIDEADNKVLVAAFTNGLRKGKFLFSLYKNDLKTKLDVLYRGDQVYEYGRPTTSLEREPQEKGKTGGCAAR